MEARHILHLIQQCHTISNLLSVVLFSRSYQILLQEDIEGKQKGLKTLPYTSRFARDPYCISWQALIGIWYEYSFLFFKQEQSILQGCWFGFKFALFEGYGCNECSY